MAYLGNQPVVGDSANTFKTLDDIASFTLTFDATDTSIVSISGNTLFFRNHRFVNLQRVTYADGGGTAIGGFSWGRLSGFTRGENPISIGVTGLTIDSGLTTYPSIQRRDFGLRDTGSLRKDLG